MATITEIVVERSYTINLGNFESARIGANITIHLAEGDDPDEAYETAVEFAENRLMADMQELQSDDT